MANANANDYKYSSKYLFFQLLLLLLLSHFSSRKKLRHCRASEIKYTNKYENHRISME